MILHVCEAKYVRDFVVWLRFNDGSEGEGDLQHELYGEVFEPLRDIAEFRRMRFDPELHAIAWPNSADFAPEFLHERLAVPVQSNRKSIDWCKPAVEVCWNAKKNQIREPERTTAKAAYDEAAKIYETRLKEAIAE